MTTLLRAAIDFSALAASVSCTICLPSAVIADPGILARLDHDDEIARYSEPEVGAAAAAWVSSHWRQALRAALPAGDLGAAIWRQAGLAAGARSAPGRWKVSAGPEAERSSSGGATYHANRSPKREAEGQNQERNGQPAPRNAVTTALPRRVSGTRLANGRKSGASWRDFGQGGPAGGHEIGDSLVLVDTQMAGIGADETLVEDASGKLVEVVLLECGQEAGADLGGDGDVVQRDLALFPLPLQPCPKGFHLGRFLLPLPAAGRIKDIRVILKINIC